MSDPDRDKIPHRKVTTRNHKHFKLKKRVTPERIIISFRYNYSRDKVPHRKGKNYVKILVSEKNCPGKNSEVYRRDP